MSAREKIFGWLILVLWIAGIGLVVIWDKYVNIELMPALLSSCVYIDYCRLNRFKAQAE